MNKVILKGNLTRDPEVSVVPISGGRETSVAKFTIAVSRYFKNKSGQKEQRTSFIACEAWDKMAENLGQFTCKGSPLLLEGKLENDNWEKEGKKFSRLYVRVSDFELIGSKADTDALRAQKDNAPADAAPVVSANKDDSPDEPDPDAPF